MKTIFIYIYQFWGVTVFDAPYTHPFRTEQPTTYNAVPAHEPTRKVDKYTMPAVGDTIFINNEATKTGWWGVIVAKADTTVQQ